MSIDQSLVNRVRTTLADVRASRVPPLAVDERIVDGRAVLALTGEIDLATAPRVRAGVDTALASGARELCIDLTATTFMDSTGVHTLLEADGEAAEHDCALTIVCPPGPVRRVFEIAGAGELLPLSDAVAV